MGTLYSLSKSRSVVFTIKEGDWPTFRLGSLPTTFDQASDKAICLCTSVSSDSKGLRCARTHTHTLQTEQQKAKKKKGDSLLKLITCWRSASRTD